MKKFLLLLIILQLVISQNSDVTFKSIGQGIIGFGRLFPSILRNFRNILVDATRNEAHKKIDRLYNASRTLTGDSSS